MSAEITKKEADWLYQLNLLMRRKPSNIWFFCNGRATVMKRHEGEKMHTQHGGVDPDYQVDVPTLPDFDGGDW